MAVEQLFEIAAVVGRVDRQAGVIAGVKIIGLESRNGRTYLPEALRRAVQKYEGVAVNTDHVRPGEQRRVAERFGCLRNIRATDAGLFADLHFLTSHLLASAVAEAAERLPNAFGLSHDIRGKVTRRNGKTIVEEIEAVRSVDIVSDPATTSGLFESVDSDAAADKLADRSLAEALGVWRDEYPQAAPAETSSQRPSWAR